MFEFLVLAGIWFICLGLLEVHKILNKILKKIKK